MKRRIEKILNLFPEVVWDRFSGHVDKMVVFGWIQRKDAHADFLLLRIEDGIITNFTTSSEHYSASFAHRLGFFHSDCGRVENVFKNVSAVKLPAVKR
jgi:hypothetical protein